MALANAFFRRVLSSGIPTESWNPSLGGRRFPPVFFAILAT